jgi:hypothetical protein
MWRIAILLLAACTDPPKQAFVVDGFVNVLMSPEASVIGVWEIAGDPVRHYKLGDGVRLDSRFTLGFDTDPPPEALNADGIGVALVVMLPGLSTVPDGPVNLAPLAALGVSASTAIIYKAGTATGPAWSEQLPLRFSCARCLRDPGTALDTYELTACASVLVEDLNTPLCEWF